MSKLLGERSPGPKFSAERALLELRRHINFLANPTMRHQRVFWFEFKNSLQTVVLMQHRKYPVE
jgi:hypothetical protein